ncbi:hypothetical protein [Priestia aryabhattai]|uniref:hypothetical protein n=1 Tax=Priestia aryabhattai TaxID=412384 RepID=UPI0031010044|nr:hypothetical protein [Bacillus sp. S35]
MRPRRSVRDEEDHRPPEESEILHENYSSGVTSNLYELLYPICSSLDGSDLVMSQSLFVYKDKKRLRVKELAAGGH